MRATKIVATIGPASSSRDILEAMFTAGVDVVRLNFSHGKKEDHQQRAELVREISAAMGKEVAIIADLQGPKIRIGKFENQSIELLPQQRFILDANCTLGNQERVGLDYKNLVHEVHQNDILLLNDGLIVLKVESIMGSEIITSVKVGGVLSNHKGINKQGGGLSAPALTAKDMEDIKTAVEMRADYIAVSFAKNPTDMEMARQLANIAGQENGHHVKLIAKIERCEAIIEANLIELIQASDAIMVARGDLAVEVGNAAVPALQKKMIKLAKKYNKCVITATQMMESMIQNPVPTRAEVSDVANAVLDGTDAVMLSAETAAGKYPVETVQQVADICIAAEQADIANIDAEFLLEGHFARVDQSIANGALFTAFHLDARAIVALTESGATTLWMSRKKTHIPIYAITPNVHTARSIALYRNVRAIGVQVHSTKEDALFEAMQHLIAKKMVCKGDYIVATAGEPMGKAGGTNALQILQA